MISLHMSNNAGTSQLQMFSSRITITAAALRGMIEGANKRQKADKFEYGQWNHYTCQKSANTSN